MKQGIGSVLLCALLLLAGCEDAIELSPEVEKGDGSGCYAKLTLSLPDQSSGSITRSDGTGGNDVFGEGDSFEFSVRNGVIAFFEAPVNSVDPDKDAVFTKACDITDIIKGWNADGTSIKEITSQKSVVCEAPKLAEGKKLYALAILNTNGLVKINSDGRMMANGSLVSRLSDLQEAINITVGEMIGGRGKNEFFMTNAPVSDMATMIPGDDFKPKVTILAPVTIHKSLRDAQLATIADRLFVERVVAKVEVSARKEATINEDGSVTYPVVDDNGNVRAGHMVTFNRWRVNVTNRTTKIVRDVTGYDRWAGYVNLKAQKRESRFFGNQQNPYRIYWAVDGNYDDADALGNRQYIEANFNFVKLAEEGIEWNDIYENSKGINTTVKDYCFENTMVANQMVDGLMTGVVIEAIYRVEDNSDIYGDLFTVGDSRSIYSTSDMLSMIKRVLNLSEHTNMTFDRSLSNGGIISDRAAFKAFKIDDKSIDDALVDQLLSHDMIGKIAYYKGGRTYYYTRPIRHFGDYYTPVVDGADFNDEEHLGRFGVVRNHWYEIVIGEVNNPGYPVIPPVVPQPDPQPDPEPQPQPDPKPDPEPQPQPDPEPQPEPKPDPDLGHLKVDVNIRQWTIRWQSIDF